MDEIVQYDGRRVVQLILLGFGAAIAWVLISLFSPSTSASADDSTPPDGGALGLVQSVVGVAGQTVSSVGELVPILTPVTDVVTGTVGVVDTGFAATTEGVGTVVASVRVSSVTDPVLTAVDSVVDDVPVVTELVDSTGLFPTLSAATRLVDRTVSTLVVGPAPLLTPPTGIAPVSLTADATAGPAVPQPAAFAPVVLASSNPDARAAAPPSPSVWSGHLRDSPSPVTSPAPSPTPPPPAGAPGGATASTTAGPLTLGALLTAFSPSAHAASHLAPPPSDDDVPPDPVFATDSTPD